MVPPGRILEVLAETPSTYNSVLLIAHNPSLEELFERLTNQSRGFSTAAVARLQLDVENWSQISGNPAATLVDFWQPRGLN